MSRHPSPYELAAFFDGEDPDPTGEVSWTPHAVRNHLASCRRCREDLQRLARIRAALQGDLVPVADAGPARTAWVRRWPAALMPVAAAVALLLALAIPPGGLPVTRVDELSGPAPEVPHEPGAQDAPPAADPESPSGPPAEVDSRPGAVPAAAAVAAAGGTTPAADDRADRGAPSGEAAPAGPDDPVVAAGPAGHPPASPAGPQAVGGAALAGPPGSGRLRLGVPVPTRGPSASEGEEVLRAVRAVAEAANETGGVAGRKVDVVAVPTDHQVARSVALSRVDALVGGFAIPAPEGIPWLVPADVDPSGPRVVAGEVTAEQAGGVLGAGLRSQDVEGPAGAIVGEGPDTGLATGLAGAVPVERVTAATGTDCDGEVGALRRRGVSALAVAGPPDLARRCIQAAARLGWRPAGGLLLAPSAAYAHLELSFAAQGARTVLGFPSPRADEPGASRYRRRVSSSGSYRALVSFAAAELALDVARATGSVTAEPVRSARWQSDLYVLDGGRNASPRLVTARFARWSTG